MGHRYGYDVKSYIEEALDAVYQDEYEEKIYTGKTENKVEFAANVMSVLSDMLTNEY